MVRRQRTIWAWEQLPAEITVEEACCVMRVSEVTLRKILREGTVRRCKVGRSWRIDRDSLRAFAEGRNA